MKSFICFFLFPSLPHADLSVLATPPASRFPLDYPPPRKTGYPLPSRTMFADPPSHFDATSFSRLWDNLFDRCFPATPNRQSIAPTFPPTDFFLLPSDRLTSSRPPVQLAMTILHFSFP